MKPIQRVHISPTRLLAELERAASALPPGHQCPASEAVSYAVTKLQAVRQVQDVTLDADARTPEQRAERTVEPQ